MIRFKWLGEEICAKMFCILGMKVISKTLFDHENRLRALEGKQPVTYQQVVTQLEGILDANKSDNGEIDI